MYILEMNDYIAAVYAPKEAPVRILKVMPVAGLNAKSTLRDIAVKFVHDSVGRNNYIETLNDPRECSEFPSGIVLKYSNDTESDPVFDIKIHMYKNTQRDAGWVRSCMEIVSEEIGLFSYVNIEEYNNVYAGLYDSAETERMELKKKVFELSREVELLREDAKYAVRTHSAPRVNLLRNDVQDLTIELIRNFDRNSLRKIHSEPIIAIDDESDDPYVYCDEGYYSS